MIDTVRVLQDSPLAARLQEELTCSPLDTLQWLERNAKPLKSDKHSRVGILDIGGVQTVVKFYRHKSVLIKFLHGLGIGRPFRSFRAARVLGREGVPVADSIGCLVLPEGVLLLSDWIGNKGTLHDMWQRENTDEEMRRALQIAGQAIAQLHQSGYSHGDCKWANLLWDGRSIVFVDLDNAVKTRSYSGRQSRDLARFTLDAEALAIGPQYYNCFLESYLQVMEESRREAVERMVPYLYSLRARHLASYGPRGQRLI